MINKLYIKILFFGLIFCLFDSYVFAGHKNPIHKYKVSLIEFKNPPKWKKKYFPGNILTARLKYLLRREKTVYLLPEKNQSTGSANDPLSGNNINENRLQYSYRGEQNQNLFNNSGLKNFYPSVDNRLHWGRPNYQNRIHKINYVNGQEIFEILPIQDSKNDQKEINPDTMPALEVDPVPWPVRLGGEPLNGTLYEIKGQIITFNPDAESTLIESNLLKNQNYENAELEVIIQVVQKKTGRLINEKKFKTYSNNGSRPFTEDIDTYYDKWNKDNLSSMSLAISDLTNEVVSYLNKLLLKFPFEADIISLKNGEVLINVGKQNGVMVGDKFHVYSVGLGLNDPFIENDLGDIYVKTGIVKVKQVLPRYSRALAIVGKDFMLGDTVRFLK